MYSAETRERVLALYAKGMSVREISNVLGGRPGKSIINQWVKGFAPTGKRQRQRRSYTVDDKVRAMERLRCGESYRDIAEEMGCTPSAVIIWRKAYEDRGIEGLKTSRDMRIELEQRARGLA